MALTGCGRSNGLPPDITSHLATRGISIHVTRFHAPLSSRGGYVVVEYDPNKAADIVAKFKLEKIQADSGPWQLAVGRAGVVAPKELWGAVGRPPQFKLKDGGQFEFFFVLIAPDGWMYLLAEYAYG